MSITCLLGMGMERSSQDVLILSCLLFAALLFLVQIILVCFLFLVVSFFFSFDNDYIVQRTVWKWVKFLYSHSFLEEKNV